MQESNSAPQSEAQNPTATAIAALLVVTAVAREATLRKIGEPPKKLPARLSRLARGFAIIFVGKPIPPAATALTAPSTVAATAAISAATAAAGTPATTTAWSSKSTGTRAARRSTFSLGTCFIHFQITPTGLFAVQTRDRLRCFFVIRHFHKRETTSPARFAIHGHVHARHLPKGLEQRP
jgi:hypothetical protein